METKLKKQIVDAARKYCGENRLGQDEIATIAGISPGYINSMFKGKETHKAGKDNEAIISDKTYRKLAQAIKFPLEKEYWETIETSQYLSIKATLITAKANGRTAMIIGSTGCGKTYTVNNFCIDYPVNTFRLTMSCLYTLQDVLNELCEKLKITTKGNKLHKMNRVIERLRNIKLEGGKPIIIFDEAENMGIALLKMLKGLYDGIKNYCSIVLIGTNQLTDKLNKLKTRDKDGIPQFCRRFKAGKVELKEVQKKEMAGFFENFGIADKNFIDLLLSMAENYGELNDYLEPAFKEADRLEQPLDIDLFRMIYDLK